MRLLPRLAIAGAVVVTCAWGGAATPRKAGASRTHLAGFHAREGSAKPAPTTTATSVVRPAASAADASQPKGASPDARRTATISSRPGQGVPAEIPARNARKGPDAGATAPHASVGALPAVGPDGTRPAPSGGPPATAPPPSAARPGLFSPRSDGRSRRPTQPTVTAAYRETVRRWHEASENAAPLGPRGLPTLVLVNLNTKERATLEPLESTGTFSEADREQVAHLFREPGSENAHPVSPRLLDALYTIQEHFHAGELRVLSGYRSPWEGNSNHGKGRAADLIVPGTTDEAVAAFARGLGFVGIGIYPTSHFVHVDVRDASYFWVDASAPGRPHRERGILAQAAKEADVRARLRGGHPTAGPKLHPDASSWLAARTQSAELPEAEIQLPAGQPDAQPEGRADEGGAGEGGAARQGETESFTSADGFSGG